jgi:hypothetical protein
MDELVGGSQRTPTRGWGRGWSAPALVFFTSAAVLVLEILAGRLVAPYVGVSLETYTGIIGTVLAGIALGSAAGGRIADSQDPRWLLGPLLIASGATSWAALPIIAALGPGIAQNGGGVPGILTLAVTAFVLPTALLSAVSPMVAKLRLESTAETGTVVGGLSAAGTAGALVGTFATGFVFVAAWPTRPIVIVVGGMLMLLGLAMTVRLRKHHRWAAPVVALLVPTLAWAIPSPCARETRYHCATVVTDPARPSGRTLLLDNLRHSYVDLRDPTHLEFRYTRLFAAVVDATLGDRPLRSLHIGGGGFTFPRWLVATRPGSTNTVLEVDPDIVDIAVEDLGLEPGRSLKVRIGDARLSITDEPTSRYDLVVGDAFGGLSVPWHLTTVEMVREVARTLRPNGVYVLNVIDAGPHALVRAELATLRRVFAEVAVVAPPDGPAGNYVLVASDRPFELGDSALEGDAVTGSDIPEFVGDAEVLRDDFAPADQLLSRT